MNEIKFNRRPGMFHPEDSPKRRRLGWFLIIYAAQLLSLAFAFAFSLVGCESTIVSVKTPYDRGQTAAFAALAFADTTPEEAELQAVAEDLTAFLDSNRTLTVEIVRRYSDRIAEKTKLSRAQVVIVTMALSRSLADNEQRAREFLRGVRDALNLLNPPPIERDMTNVKTLFGPISETALAELETPRILPPEVSRAQLEEIVSRLHKRLLETDPDYLASNLSFDTEQILPAS